MARLLGLILALSLLLGVGTACSAAVSARSAAGHSPSAAPSSRGANSERVHALGSFPSGVVVNEAGYELVLRSVSILPTGAVELDFRNAWGPQSARGRRARDGYRFVDLVIDAKASRPDLPVGASVLGSATITADGGSFPADGPGLTEQAVVKPREWRQTIEFEVPEGSKSAVVVFPLQPRSPAGISFRLW